MTDIQADIQTDRQKQKRQKDRQKTLFCFPTQFQRQRITDTMADRQTETSKTNRNK